MQSIERADNNAPGATGPASALPVRPGPAGRADPAARRLRIFIVEDNEIIRESLVATLEELANADIVGNAVDEWTAIQWLGDSRNRCDLAIVDIFLRSGSGLGVLRSVNRIHPPRRLIVLSNYATDDIRKACRELGADGIFDKSNDIDALLDYCRQLAASPGEPAGDVRG
jgi:DNA-binding NarL/FixJ family response regulator